jgi:hypothetical protein
VNKIQGLLRRSTLEDEKGAIDQDEKTALTTLWNMPLPMAYFNFGIKEEQLLLAGLLLTPMARVLTPEALGVHFSGLHFVS